MSDKPDLLPDHATIWRNADGTYGVSPTNCVESIQRIPDVKAAALYTPDISRAVKALEKRYAETNDRHASDYVRGMHDAFDEAIQALTGKRT